MAKKSKGFNELLLKEQSFDNLKRKVNRYGNNVKLVHNRGEIEKMSEVLEMFLDPYTDIVHNQQGLQVLYSMGMLAWNIALMPKDKRDEMLDDAFSKLHHSAEQEEVGKDLVRELYRSQRSAICRQSTVDCKFRSSIYFPW